MSKKFMEKQILHGNWWACETSEGTEYLAVGIATLDRLHEHCEGEILEDPTITPGWGARLSAPGYLDCTPWVVFDTKKEAEEYLEELEGDNEEDSESEQT